MYVDFAGREVVLQRAAVTMVQRLLFAAFCNVPHFCALFAVPGDVREAILLRTSIDWLPAADEGENQNGVGARAQDRGAQLS